ncbi:ABC transporter ATP-binding protein [Trinickia caryophylli]|uniref:Iron complex transport system ATP-binding protein n=1 Tax=Trinickia caryophylli TaxID=28094 RepID=A0A1X7GXT6_TRICW|nr:ABC transporter ATP-binding protein [Trinickia caryophylli]PMS10159.1 ABC transporter ATP-binding protein [Trinickia caryophylli]TRX18259.1 ABC transporter ATP-binding protein [Trinickia caryophylli]WQE10955.1 ABC transporter ATP-binding protein [Trinickia caryophylli]SMF76240.1 iron complex transport system ATP-binding protein [Trinickia caryophylli]GLU35438.1 ABC transporter ATP-binding protein [Trinickia caryophylli]
MTDRHTGHAHSLATRGLKLAGGGRTLLEHCSQTFGPGEIWCIAGPNGAGKTTLISTLAGLLSPAAGAVELDGVPIGEWPRPALARRRALMPQSTHDVFSASVLDVVLLNRFPHLAGWGWEAATDREAARAALDALALGPLAARDVMSLSGGERQRVALAAALCQDAPLLLLDEPLAHLDLHHQIDCLTVLARWVEQGPRTIVFSCHDLNLARRFATHALLMDGEGDAHAGTARDILAPGLASRVFGFPLVLVEQDGYEALVPALRTPRRNGGGVAG